MVSGDRRSYHDELDFFVTLELIGLHDFAYANGELTCTGRQDTLILRKRGGTAGGVDFALKALCRRYQAWHETERGGLLQRLLILATGSERAAIDAFLSPDVLAARGVPEGSARALDAGMCSASTAVALVDATGMSLEALQDSTRARLVTPLTTPALALRFLAGIDEFDIVLGKAPAALAEASRVAMAGLLEELAAGAGVNDIRRTQAEELLAGLKALGLKLGLWRRMEMLPDPSSRPWRVAATAFILPVAEAFRR
jgi:hypothetical protein